MNVPNKAPSNVTFYSLFRNTNIFCLRSSLQNYGQQQQQQHQQNKLTSEGLIEIIRIFTGRILDSLGFKVSLSDNAVSDQTARMRRLI